MLPNPATKIHQILVSPKEDLKRRRRSPVTDVCFRINPQLHLGNQMIEDHPDSSFYIVRDDLLHPLVNGNKARKLDAMLPLIEEHSVTDVVTCGGCQSAHAAAVAVSCAERGIKSHLLLRGEQPEILTGYNLVSTIYGNVTYVPRSLYANREKMLLSHANLIAGHSNCILNCSDLVRASFTNQRSLLSNSQVLDAHEQSKESSQKVLIVNEGAGDAVALLGMFRLVHYLSQEHLLGRKRAVKFILDAGTGTTAVGLAFAALCLRLPWEVTAVRLADTIERYREQERHLFCDFMKHFGSFLEEDSLNMLESGIVNWVERNRPRKFGNVLDGEIEVCQHIAQQTGVLLDPIYTLAAWEKATQLAMEYKCDADVVMLHTGGTLSMFGLAQRYKSYFRLPKD